MTILFLGNGNDPRTIGGIQSFSRTLGKMFRENFVFLIKSKKTKRDCVYEVENNIYSYFERNFITKIIKKAWRPKLSSIAYKRKIKKIDKRSIIISSPQELELISEPVRTILVQHTSCDMLWKRPEYFNQRNELIEKCREKLDYFIAVSPKDRDEIERKFRMPREKIRVIRHSTEVTCLNHVKVKARKLVMISRLDNRYKRVDLAISAMQYLPDFMLNIYGSGPDEVMLRTLVKDYNLINVQFHGNTNEVSKKLDENSIYIMTSDIEGYGISNIEAMRRGLPIILRDTFPAAGDIVQGNGVLLDKEWRVHSFCEAVKHVYSNYEEYSTKSIELSKRYDPELIREKWREILC